MTFKTQADALYKAIKDAKKLPKPELHKKQRAIITVSRRKQRPVTYFGTGSDTTQAFAEAKSAVLENFNLTAQFDWVSLAFVTDEQRITKEEFISKVETGYSDWDGISLDVFYNYAIIKQDIDNFSLVTRSGMKNVINDLHLTEIFRRRGIIGRGLYFNSASLPYVFLFKCEGMVSTGGEILPFCGSDLEEINSTLAKKEGEISLGSLRNATVDSLTSTSVYSVLLSQKAKTELLQLKLDKIYKKFYTSKIIKTKFEESGNGCIFITVSDTKSRGTVFTGTGATIKEAFTNAQNSAVAYCEVYGLTPVWVKVDITAEVEVCPRDIFEKAISLNRRHGNVGAYGYPKSVSFDKSFSRSFLSSEINAYGIWDYTEKKFVQSAIDDTFIRRGLGLVRGLPENVYIFDTIGFLCDENENVYKLATEGDEFGRRSDSVDKAEVERMIEINNDFLLRNQKADGSFVYGMHPSNQAILTSYNLPRHCGTSVAIMQYMELFGLKNTKPADSANAYTISEMKDQKKDTSFLFDKNANEFKLGGNALGVIALTSYSDFFPTAKYNQNIIKLVNGILSLQQEDGSFNHVLKPDFSLKEPFRTVYYDGEAVYALVKAYMLLKNQTYLDAAEKAIKYFIANNYEKYSDHWVAYALNEITKVVPKQEYFDFASKNVMSNLTKIYNQRTSYHTFLELLMAAFNTMERLEGLIAKGEKGADGETLVLPKDYDRKELIKTIKYRVDYMSSSYLYPEFAMYMKEPQKVAYTFTVRHHNWRIRIDDLQHYIGGLYEYCKNYDVLNN